MAPNEGTNSNNTNSSSCSSCSNTNSSSSCNTNYSSLQSLLSCTEVIVHPLVLLSVVDHYNRCARGTSKRVVGTLLGEITAGRIVHVTNSYAVPFEEDPKHPTVWFFDLNYHQHLLRMFKKVNAKERVVGWYSSGQGVRVSDLDIHELYRKDTPHPVYVLVDIQPKDDYMVPTTAYLSFEEPTSDNMFRKTFMHVPSTIGAYEAEEVGVEHLLRDLRNASTSTLATQVGDKLTALKCLVQKLKTMKQYIRDVVANNLPANPDILYNLQDVLNLLPDLDKEELVRAFAVEANDALLTVYLGSIVRAIMGLHDLITNKVK